jgi:hypothetical protein
MKDKPACLGKKDVGEEPVHGVTLSGILTSGDRRCRSGRTPENAPATSARKEIANLVSYPQPLPPSIGSEWFKDKHVWKKIQGATAGKARDY